MKTLSFSVIFERIIDLAEHGDYAETKTELENLLQQTQVDSSEHVLLRAFYAYICRDQGKNTEAIELLSQLKSVAKENRYLLPLMYILSELSYNHWKLSHYDTVKELIEEIEGIRREYEKEDSTYGVFEDHVLARIFNIKGLVDWHLGLLLPASKNFRLFLEKSIRLNHDHGIGVANNNLAALNYQLGNVDDALEYINKAIEKWDKLKKARGFAYAYKNLGLIYHAQNKTELSLKNFELALDRFASLKNEVDQAITLFNMIQVSLSEGDMVESVKNYLKKLEKIIENNKHSTIIRHYEMAQNITYMYTGRLKEISKAYSYFTEFLKSSKIEFKLAVLAVTYICEYLIIELRNNNLDEIFEELTSYIRKLKELGTNAPSYSVIIEALILEAKIVFTSGDINSANELLDRAKDIADDHGHFALVQRVQNEQSLFNSRITNIRKMLDSDATKYELLNEVEIKSYIDEIKKMLGV